ncbi:MAG: Radical SAM superfamily protein [bacterium ADurb.Bin243]|nr:MAG: Radical SAM superfamily protein [bacterium ADurb.Bin243]
MNKNSNFKILLLDAPENDMGWFNGNVASPALGYIAAYVKNDFDVKILDLHVEDHPWLTLKQTLLDFKPDLIGITFVHTCHHSEVNSCLRMIKKISPASIVAGGGYLFGVLYEKYIKSGLIDIAVIGEGELTFKYIAATLAERKKNSTVLSRYDQPLRESLKQIEGLAMAKIEVGTPLAGFDSNFEVYKSPPRKFIENLDSIPFPAFELFPMDRYNLPIYGGRETFGAMFSRGCANRCSFCTESAAWNHTVRRHSPEYAIKYLKLLYEVYGKKTFVFGDTDFLSKREWVKGFIDNLKASGMKINFFIQACCTSVIKCADLLPELKRLGLFKIMLGAESPFGDVLKLLNKGMQNRNIILRAMDIVKRNDVLLLIMMIWGTEHDTEESLIQELKFFSRYADFISPGMLTPYPGTSLYERLKDKDLIMVDDLSMYDQLHVIMPAGKMSYLETVTTYRKNLFLHFNANWKTYRSLFSKNKFLKRIQWFYFQMMWNSFYKDVLAFGQTNFKKHIIHEKEYDGIMNG